jgi:signal transduction histidine kinase
VIAGHKINSSIAVADINRDGRDELAVALRDGRVLLLDGHGHLLPGWPQSAAYWNLFSPLICDINGDGEYEIIVASFDEHVYAWDRKGRPLPGWPVDCGARPSSSPQLLKTGRDASCILIACADGSVHVIQSNGDHLPSWPRSARSPLTSFNDYFPIRNADLDDDGIPEVLLLARKNAVLQLMSLSRDDHPGFPVELGGLGRGIALDDYNDPTRIACTTNREIIVLDTGGAELFRRQLPEGDRYVSAPAFILSAGDAEPEIDLLLAGTKNGTVYAWEKNGELRNGWPIHLGGFIYGLFGAEEKFSIFDAPRAWDVDGDAELEILVGSVDQHLYCFELDGSSAPGWPVTLGDQIWNAPVFAQLDGTGRKELVIGQNGESIFAFYLEPHETAPLPAGSQEPDMYRSGEWLHNYFAVTFAIGLLAILLILRLRANMRAGRLAFAVSYAGWILLAGFVTLVVVRGVLFIGNFQSYRDERNRLRDMEPKVQKVLADKQNQVNDTAAALATDLDSSLMDSGSGAIKLLYALERLADHHRLDYEYTGLMLADESGHAVQAVGLARGWRSLADLGLGIHDATGPALMGEIPVLVGISPIGKKDSQKYLVLFSSLLDELPHVLSGVTGSSVHIRLNGKTKAWGGASPIPSPSFQPWLGIVVPSLEVPMSLKAGEQRLSLLFTVEDYENTASMWLDLCIVLLLPVLCVAVFFRRSGGGLPQNRWWFISFAAIYAIGFFALARGQAIQRPVPLSGHALEFLLHLFGLLGITVMARAFWNARRGTRLSIAVLFSYLVVGLIPLVLVLVFATNLLQQAQRKVIGDTVSGLEERAEHLAMAYMAKNSFLSNIKKLSPQLLSRSPETNYYSFVGEDQMLFAYELPSAYLTLWVQDRSDPTLHFTGFSWRAPRTEKFFSRLPEWMSEGNQRGVFLDGGKTMVRAVRSMSYSGLDIQLASHIPLDETIMENLEDRLRILPFLPRVRLQPAWHGTAGSARHGTGWDLPLRTTQVLSARDWRTGAPRWIAYEARAYLPDGREKWTILAVVVLLALLPWGLSAWGAYYTFKRTVQPLNRLLTGIRRVEKGDLKYRLADPGRSEIALSSRAFDRMADSLEANVRELAEKKKVEEISALKTHFISMISHDLKTPLASIKGAAENVLEELAGPVTDKQRRYLEMILSSSENLQKMISDILDLSHIESGRIILTLETLDLKREVETALRAIRPVLEDRRIETRITSTIERARVRADRSRLWQILNNIMSNAIRYSPEGGRIDIVIDDGPAGAAGGHGHFLRITLTDEGPGIPEEEKTRLFDPFYSRPAGTERKHGAGLGLAIVKQLVELHGGELSLTNSEQGGAVLSFTLPAAV